jgi:multidrug efflux pump subunit AcrA (membrane-fusion protein)
MNGAVSRSYKNRAATVRERLLGMSRLVRLGALALAIVAALPAAEATAASTELRLQIADVERAIDSRFGQIRTDSQPMMLLGATRGAYLDGYGAVFTVEVNLYPAAALNPFRQSYSDAEKQQLNIRKRQRLETLEAEARAILVEETKRLTALSPGDKVALAVSLFHFNWEDLTGLPRQMVASAARSALDEVRAGSLTAAEGKKRLELRYF